MYNIFYISYIDISNINKLTSECEQTRKKMSYFATNINPLP